MSYEDLNAKQKLFVDRYLAVFNAKDAAVKAGYSAKNAAQTANQLMRNPKIQAAINEKMAPTINRLEVTRERILEEYARIAFASMSSYVKLTADGEPYIDLSSVDDDDMAAIAETVVEDFTDGRGEDARDVRRVRVKMHDKIAALRDLAKIQNMFEKHEQARTDPLTEALEQLTRRGAQTAPIASQKPREDET